MEKIVENRGPHRGGNRGYASAADRKRAIRGLRAQGFNYFVGYRDVASDYALNYGIADWVAPGSVYRKDI